MDNQMIGPAGIMSGYMMPSQMNGFSIPGMNNNLMPNQHPTIKVDEGVKTEIDENELNAHPVPTLDIKVSNVVCKFRVRCHINLRKLAQEAFNTEYDAAHSVSNFYLFHKISLYLCVNSNLFSPIFHRFTEYPLYLFW